MNVSAQIEPPDLLEEIREAYGLPLENLCFLLRGWGGDCYRAETPGGDRYFLKFHDKAQSLALAASSRAFYLPLTHQLHHKRILPNIPHPIPTRTGAYSLEISPYDLVITNYIEGELVGFGELPDHILVRLAAMVGVLHRSRPELEFDHPFFDSFEIAFEGLLAEQLDDLKLVSAGDGVGRQDLKAALLPRAEDVLQALNHLKSLKTYAQSSNKPKVICHTDIHGGNLMIGPSGELYILDWENALIAPPEHDLMFFAGEPGFFDVFFPKYCEKADAPILDLKLLEFYYYRRALEDFADYILRINAGTGSAKQDQEDIQECLGILEGLGGINQTLARVRAQLPPQFLNGSGGC